MSSSEGGLFVFLKKCTGRDRGGVDKLSPYGVTSAALVNEIATLKEANLIHDTFGSDLDSGVLVTTGDDPAGSKCQAAVWKAMIKCQQTKLKEFLKCKKAGLKGKIPPGLVQSADDLQDLCLGTGTDGQPDLKGKIAAKCGDLA